MQVSPIMIFGLAILAYAFIQISGRSGRTTPAQPLRLWQKLAGAIAILMALLIIMNPEFLALGLLGDTAFFDLLVLALSLQLQDLAAQAWHRGHQMARFVSKERTDTCRPSLRWRAVEKFRELFLCWLERLFWSNQII